MKTEGSVFPLADVVQRPDFEVSLAARCAPDNSAEVEGTRGHYAK